MMGAEITFLQGAKVRIVPFAPEDVTDAYVGWLNDSEVTRFSNQRFRTHTRATCEQYRASFEGTSNQFLSIRDAKSGDAIGTMTVYASDHHGTCDVGIMIGNRDYWGGGYGQEAWSLVVDYLLAPTPDGGGVRKLTAGCLVVNLAMVTLMQRSGMTLEAVRKDQEMLDGEPCDIIHYARFRD